MWCQGLLSRKRGNVIFKPTLLSTVWCKCLSSVLRAQMWVTQEVFPYYLNLVQSPAVASWSFALAAFHKAAAAQEKTWPAVKEAALTEPTQRCLHYL